MRCVCTYMYVHVYIWLKIVLKLFISKFMWKSNFKDSQWYFRKGNNEEEL